MNKETEFFNRFCEEARNFKVRSEILIEEVPAPQKLAPFAFALSADVVIGESDLATGRFVLLHDPDGQEAWNGKFRAVTFVRSAVESEMQSDPLLTDVAWSWFLESLENSQAESEAISGTVTKVSSASNGELAKNENSAEVEIRASWTPKNAETLIRHLAAWLNLLEVSAGLTPISNGVTAITPRR